MTIKRRWVAFLGAVLFAAIAPAAEPMTDAQIRELATKVRDYTVKHRLIAIGVPAIVPLFDQLDSKDEYIVYESRSVLRWLAAHAGEQSAQQAQTVAVLTGILRSDRPVEQRVFAACLLGLAGGDKAVEALAPLLLDEKLRDMALGALIEIQDKPAVQAMADALAKSPPDFRCDLLKAIGYRKDADFAPVLTQAAKDPDEKVRLAAIEGLGAMCDAGAAPVVAEAAQSGSDAVRKAAAAACMKIGDALLQKGRNQEAGAIYSKALETAPDDACRAAALKGLGRAADPSTLPQMTSALEKGSPAVKDAALDAMLRLADDLLDKGKASDAAPLYYRVLDSATQEAERMRALAGCGRMGDAGAVPKIAPYLKSPEERVRAAAVSALNRIAGPEVTKELASALKDAPPRLRLVLLLALGERKDPAAAGDIAPMASDADEEIAVAATKALGSIAAPASAPALLGVIEKGPAPVKAVALESYAALGDAELAKAKPQEAMAIYHRVLQSGAGERAQAVAFAGLARIADVASLPVIEPMLDKVGGDARDKAIEAYVALGDKLTAEKKRDEAVKIYSKSLTMEPSYADSLKQKLRLLGERMEFRADGGKVSYWWITGPFPAPNVASWEKPLFPETEIDLTKEYDVEGAKFRWQPVETTHKEGIVDLDKLLGPKDNVLAYAYAEIVAKKDCDAFLLSGSDDGLLVWLNGERVFAFLKNRSLKADEDKVKVRLKKGVNCLLLKVCDIGGGWNFCMRITDDQDKPLDFRVR